MIAAVVFDMDGVLIDSEETWSRVRAEFVAQHGGHWTEQDQRNVMGDNSRQWSSYIKDTWNLSLSPEEIYRGVVDAMIATYERGVTVLPGAAEAVAALAARYPLAVASSSPRELIAVALRVAGFRIAGFRSAGFRSAGFRSAHTPLTGTPEIDDVGGFRAIVSSDEVTHGKPAPDVYLLAAERLGVPAQECAAVEDSTNGIRAALAAGMATVAVPSAVYPPDPGVVAQATLVLPSLRELTPQVVAGLGQRQP